MFQFIFKTHSFQFQQVIFHELFYFDTIIWWRYVLNKPNYIFLPEILGIKNTFLSCHNWDLAINNKQLNRKSNIFSYFTSKLNIKTKLTPWKLLHSVPQTPNKNNLKRTQLILNLNSNSLRAQRQTQVVQ